MTWLWNLLGAVLGYTAIASLLTRAWRPASAPHIRQSGMPIPGTETLEVLTWNLGYGALGAEAEFLADGGTKLRALGRRQIDDAAQRIAGHLAAPPAEVLFLQEVAAPGFMTRGVDVRGRIEAALPRHRHVFASDLKTRGFPQALSFNHGLSVFTSYTAEDAQITTLPRASKLYAGFLRKHYFGVATRVPIAGTGKAWRLINIHLPAFDADARDRIAQLDALLEIAQLAYAQGEHVVIGGDWNLRLRPTDFPHATEERHLFWIHDIPEDILPTGWAWVTDPQVPTVRTLNAPFQAGVSYTTIIDGFLVSPNVEVLQVATDDLGFADTDHHPVRARLRARLPATDAGG